VLIAAVLGLTGWAWGARVLRAQTMSLRNRDFVQAARANGEPLHRIILVEMLPNLMAIIASSFVGTMTAAVLGLTTLAFIGVIPVSNLNWGTILFWAQQNSAFPDYWWWYVPAGLCIALLGSHSPDQFRHRRVRQPATALGRRACSRVEEEGPEGDERRHRGPHGDADDGSAEYEGCRMSLIDRDTAAYLDASLAVSHRVADLVGRMTVAEKVGQMMQWDARGIWTTSSSSAMPARSCTPLPRRSCAPRVDRPDASSHPPDRRRGLHPRPLVLGGRHHLPDAAGHGRDVGPRPARARRTRDGDGSGGDRHPLDLLTGALHRTRSALGRVGETFGEDPFLIGELASAMVRGYQGRGLRDETAILATAKHFAGYSETQGGRDASEADISRRKLRSWFLLRSNASRARAARRSCSATRPPTGFRSPSTTGCWTTCCVASGATRAHSSPTGTTSAAWCGSRRYSPTTRTPPRRPFAPATTWS
jgi:hypothetical protein